MIWLLTLTALADPWALPTRPDASTEATTAPEPSTAPGTNEEEAPDAPAEEPPRSAPTGSSTAIRTVPASGLLYRVEPEFEYPMHAATSQRVECHAEVIWAADGSLEQVYVPLSSTCPLAFAHASSQAFPAASIEPFTPAERIKTTMTVRMVLQSAPALGHTQDIYAITQPLPVQIDHCALAVWLGHRPGVLQVLSSNRERCSFDSRKRVKVSRSVLKSLTEPASCEVRATAVNWELTDLTFTRCDKALREEATRLLEQWQVVQSPSPKHVYDIRLEFPGPQ